MVLQVEENQESLTELVLGRENYQLYRKGEESRNGEPNGRELQPGAFSPPHLVSLYGSQCRPGETYEMFKKRSIVKANPKKNVFNAYLMGHETGESINKVPVTYFKINQN